MKINRENYEPYFIDLIDGTLSDQQVDELLDFMRENPDLAEDLNGLEKTKLQPDESLKYNHHTLLKTDLEHPDIFEETCIRAIENELSKEEKHLFQNYLKINQIANREFLLYQATISEPDISVVYTEKDKLKKIRTLNPFWYSIAAIFLIGFFFWVTNKNEEQSQQLAQKTEIKTETLVVQPKGTAENTHIQKHTRPTKAKSKLVTTKNDSAENNVIRNFEAMKPLPVIENIQAIVTEPMMAAGLAPMKVTQVVQSEKQKDYPTIPELIAHQLSKFNIRSEASKLGKAALDRVSLATNEKLAYATNIKGQVNKIEFNSKLLAFSFPVNSKKY